MRAVLVMLALMLAGCASGGADKEVAAVVQSETARQAAAGTAQAGEGSEAALKAGAEAAPAAATAKTESPPT